ncbi:MAG: efflux RND transporter permease subunit [Balneola sp.]|nr:MAG: efflux RND transporter permease subunit [Balneola sp.]
MLLRKPIASVIIVLAVLIFGGISLSRLSVELLPDVSQPSLLISTEYIGAPASEVEYRINEPLEGIMGSVKGVKEIRGLARQGKSLLFLTFNWGTDMDLAFLNVREKLDQARYLLPEQSERPQIIYASGSDQPVATLSLSNKNQEIQSFSDQLELKQWAEQVFTRRLEQQEGIAQAILVGAVEPEVQINYDPSLLDRFDVSLAQVQQVVQDANLFSSTGELRDGWYRYALKIESRINSIEDIRQTPVKSLANGRVLLLDELADITLTEADPTSFALLDDKEILSVQVKKEFGSNTVSVFETLLETLGEIETQYPEIEIGIVLEDATYIQNSISNLLQTLLIGGVLAFMVLFLFLNDARTPFTIGISIPASIFLTFTLMFVLDIQLNIISLSGLTLGIGLLLDNSIVVLENINRYKEQGLDRFTASLKGTREIALAVTASTFTTVSVFLPLLFLGGFEGAFFRDLAATLSISLLSSLLVALIILPVFVAQFSSDKESKILGRISIWLTNLVQAYERSLSKVKKRPLVVFVVASLLIASTIGTFLYIDKASLPESEPDQLEYLITLPGNTSLRSTQEIAFEVVRTIQSNSDIEGILAYAGYTDDISLNTVTDEALNKLHLSIPVSNQEQIFQVETIFEQLLASYDTWDIIQKATRGFTVVESSSEVPVEVSIIGEDRTFSKRVGSALFEELSDDFPSLQTQEKYPQRVSVYQLRFKSKELLNYGISEREVINYLESVSRGKWITDWTRQDENVSVRLRAQGQQVIHPDDISLNFDDKIIPLSDLVIITEAEEAEQIERIGQAPVLTFTTNLSYTDWWWKSALINEEIQQFMRETSQEVRVFGQAPELIELLKQLGMLLSLSVLLIYLILAIQYENLLYPLLIILAIPFAWIGSIGILFVTGLSLNALSFMGILILTGIAVNDSILKIDFMRRYLAETGDLDAAIQQAGINRFRPVVMTSLTTILGLIPMLIPIGDGYVFRQSLAIALVGGLFTSTLLTLYIIPTVFRVINRKKYQLNKTS